MDAKANVVWYQCPSLLSVTLPMSIVHLASDSYAHSYARCLSASQLQALVSMQEALLITPTLSYEKYLLFFLSSFFPLMSVVEDIWDILGKVGEKWSMLLQCPSSP